jgi:glycine/D-amino acid oxidase-like deaminating enzyme
LNQPVHRVAIVGTGVIGASWAAYYLARGFDVVATDPGPQLAREENSVLTGLLKLRSAAST